MARTEALPRGARPEVPYGGGSHAAWGVAGLMEKSILPDDARERRRRVRLCALRAMDRLGLLGEGSLIPTLDRRPELRWLADEEGARWAVLAQLGRIGKPEVFEEAVEWTLQNRPRPEEAGAYVRLLRSGALPSTGTGGLGGMPTAQQAASSVSRLHRATGKKMERRC